MKILVVDDELDVKTLFEQKFRKEIKSHEIDFLFANSGAEALEILDTIASESLTILSDINMPGMSGLDLLSQIRKKYCSPPPVVNMITAYGDQESFMRAKQLGADDFLTKPLDFVLLRKKLQHIDDLSN